MPEDTPVADFDCALCRTAYKGKNGLSLHERRAHPESYHSKNIPKVRIKGRYPRETLLLIAREEVRIKPLIATPSNLYQLFRTAFPHFLVDQLKYVRNKQKLYKELLAEVRASQSTSITTPTVANDVVQPDVTPNDCAQQLQSSIVEDQLHCKCTGRK